ncbi:MAG TPA: CBS domain-containing protein [Kiritimatiellia bacterium]|nr:CBS domain-containing protein [Kiritimatiellia bacterium]HMO99590.1 CBS domain-containing protein [Kiritimatiellia bacterium]HMP96021.1 CBS domain-containing protein [Kiritimatiellia bacterium]
MSKVILVREVMATGLLTLKPDMPIFQAIGLLLKNKVSGAPVVDENNKLVGVLSEKDCLRIFANEAFFSETAGGAVADYMTREVQTIDPDAEVFAAADVFMKHSFRRLPVVDDGNLVGQLSRRDILMASMRIVEESPKKKAWSDARYIPEEIKAVLEDRAHAD